MNTRRQFLITLGTGLLAAKAVWSAPAAAPADAAEVVRQYLAFHATSEWTKAYELLSPATQKNIPFDQFADAKRVSGGPSANELALALTAVVMLFVDSGSTIGYKYQVVGIDPADAHVALVSARLHTDGPVDATPPLLLRVVTVPDPKTGNALRVDMEASLERTDPVGSAMAREKARQTASLSNLKQLALGIIVYTQDHDETFPPAETWVDAIMPYLGTGLKPAEMAHYTAGIFRDQTAPAGQKWCYAFNSNLAGLKQADMNNVSTTVMLFETTNGVKNAADTGDSVPRPGWHTNGVDYCFADGHAKWVADKGPQPSFAP